MLISDLGLPDGSGIDLMQTLQSKRPVIGIALTGFGMEDDIRKGREADSATTWLNRLISTDSIC